MSTGRCRSLARTGCGSPSATGSLPALAALLALAGCATLAYPPAADVPLNVDGREVTVTSLDCSADGAVVAAGWIEATGGLEGVILTSADRGMTWRRASVEPAASGVVLSLLRMPGTAGAGPLYASGYRGGTGLFAGQLASSYPPGAWWTTGDGGATWRSAVTPMPLFPTRDLAHRVPRVVVADRAGTLVSVHDHPEPGVLAEDRIVVLRSTDGSGDWHERILPELTYAADIVSDGLGWLLITGIARSDGVVLWSADSGVSWAESRLPPPVSRSLRVYRNPDGTLLAFNAEELTWHGMSTHLYRSVNGGRRWDGPLAFRLGRIVSMAGNANGRMIALTASGVVLVSDDSGIRWRGGANRSYPRTPISSSLMIATDDGVVVATLDRGRLIRSTDWGETWSPVDSGLPEYQYVLSEHCADRRGLIVLAGSGGMVTRSIDGGATWIPGRMAGAHK